MPCDQCSCKKCSDHVLVEETRNLTLTERKEPECSCLAKNDVKSCCSSNAPAISDCACAAKAAVKSCGSRPSRGCACCCRSCCACCRCCSRSRRDCCQERIDASRIKGCSCCGSKTQEVKPTGCGCRS